MSAAVFQIGRRKKLQVHRNFPILMMPIRHKHHRDDSLIDGYFNKNFELHASKSLSNKHTINI